MWVRIPPPAPIFLFGSRPMRPGAGDPLKPSGRVVGAPDFVDANSFEYGTTSTLVDQLDGQFRPSADSSG